MRKLWILAVLLAVCLLLGACAPKLPEGFSADTLAEQAKSDVVLINTGDYDAVIARVRADLQKSLTAEALDEAWGETLDALGAYTGVKGVSTAGTADQQTGEDYGVAIVVAEYENGTATFTLSYDVDFELVGLYMK